MGGTTDEMMIPLTSAASTLPMSKRLRKRTPYSSTVWVMTVATRQCASRRGEELLPAKPGATVSYTPSTVLVLPTSRTRSIVTPCGRPHGVTMLLVLDVGNTNTVLGVYETVAPGFAGKSSSPRLLAHWRVATVMTHTVDEYGVLFRNLFDIGNVEAAEVNGIIISSVVPPMDSTLREVWEGRRTR